MIFHSLQGAERSSYLNQLTATIEGLNPRRFKAAWQAVVNRHELLRSGFFHEREVPLQWIASELPLSFIEHDFRGRENLSTVLERLRRAERAEPIDLRDPPLMRFVLVRTGDTRYHFIWTYHHLLTDGWSNAQVIGEVLEQYHRQQLPALKGRYRDYIEWLSSRDAGAAEAYWRQRLSELAEPTRLVNALPASGGEDGYAEQTHELDARTTQGLLDLARRERVTLNTVVQGAWALLLNRYTGEDCVSFGAHDRGTSCRAARCGATGGDVHQHLSSGDEGSRARERGGSGCASCRPRTLPRGNTSMHRCTRSSVGRAAVARGCSTR